MDYTGAFLIFCVSVNSVLLFRDTVTRTWSSIAVVGYFLFSILAWHIGDHALCMIAALLGSAHALYRVLDVLIGKTIAHSENEVRIAKERLDKKYSAESDLSRLENTKRKKG